MKDPRVRVSGALFHAFAHACVNLELVVDDELPEFLQQIDPEGFDTAQRFHEILDLVRERFVDPGPILERVGEGMMRGWYEFGPGKQLIERGVDFLHFQASSEGYRSVILGPDELVGRFTLEAIDERAGTATIYSETLFPRQLDCGVLRGGMMLTGDVLHVDVVPRGETNYVDVRFVALDERWPLAEAERLAARVRGLESERERDHRFWTATNKTLERAMAQLHSTQRALRDKNAELEANNAALQRSRDELLRMNQRAEQMFSAFAEILPGAVLGDKYEVYDKIGAGGFGVVFRGRDRNLERDVAVKIFKTPADGLGAATMERFRREGASACRVNHDNAVSIYDSGVSVGGVPYLVMELLEGLTLAELLEHGQALSSAAVLELLRPTCSVLAKVHAVGVIHRDIKPANLFLDCSKSAVRVKVLDFGIAKLLDETKASGDLTRTGSVLGTPIYIAPERLRGASYDGRADVYSLGVMAYRMLAGVSPFGPEKEHWAGMAAALTGSVPPLAELAPEAPQVLSELVMRLLDPEPDARPSAAELADELAQLELDSSGPSRLRELVIGRQRARSESQRTSSSDTLGAGATLAATPAP